MTNQLLSPFHCSPRLIHTSSPVTYIITIPIAKPAIVNIFTATIFLFLSLSVLSTGRNTQEPIEYTTWNIAPAPIDRNIMVAIGEYKNPPIQAPAIVGAWIGGFLYSPIATIIFLSIGAGAIFQVVYSIGSWVLRPVDNTDNDKNKKIVAVNIFTIAGFAIGMVIMYVTGLLV